MNMATVVWQQYSSSSSSDQQQKAELPVTSLRLKLSPQQKPDVLHLHSLSSVLNIDVAPKKPCFEGNKDCFAPLTPSLLRLSDKSLEMCTENLGSETGSDVISDDDDANIYPSSSSSDDVKKNPTIRKKTRQQSLTGHSSSCFPPPLTTMRGGERVVMRRHREEGRVVMDAVKCPISTRSNFITDRTNGRLRLTLLRIVVDDSDQNKLFIKTTDTTTTTLLVVNNNEYHHQFRQQGNNSEQSGESSSSSLDILNNNRENEQRHIKDEDEGENVTRRFQRQLPAISRCMEEEGEHEQLYHQRRHLVNLRLWVATS